jgi:hypothetical protein
LIVEDQVASGLNPGLSRSRTATFAEVGGLAVIAVLGLVAGIATFAVGATLEMKRR